MDRPTLQELQWIGAAVGIGVGAYTLLKPIVPSLWRLLGAHTWRPIVAHFGGIHQMIQTVAHMDGEISELRHETTAIKTRVEAELGPNGGSSLKDQVTMIAARQAAIFDGQARAAFQADRAGRFTSVNRAFEQLVGYPQRDLLGMRWVNLLHQDDAEAFMVVWQHAISDGRILRRTCRIVTASDVTLSVSIDAVPILVRDQAVEWQGYFVDPEVQT